MATFEGGEEGVLAAFVRELPTSDEAKAEAYIGRFLAATPLSRILVEAATLEAREELGRALMARGAAKRCCGSQAGAAAVVGDGESLAVLLEGVRHDALGVRVAALECVMAALGALGGGASQLAARLSVQAALADSLLSEDIAVAQAAIAALVAAAKGGALEPALGAVARARDHATDSTQTLRCCEADVAIATTSSEAIALARPRLDETTALACGDSKDPLLQLNAMELVSQLGSSGPGARMLLLEDDGRTLGVFAALAREGGGGAAFEPVVADAAIRVLGRVLREGATALTKGEWTRSVASSTVEGFFELALAKLGDDETPYVATLEALAAFAAASKESTEGILARGALEAAWLAPRKAASPEARAARLTSVATVLESTGSPELWAAFQAHEPIARLLCTCTSPHDQERCAALELARLGVGYALDSFVASEGFYEWVARPAVQTESSARAVNLKHAVLEATVAAARAQAAPGVFNAETLRRLAALAARGAYGQEPDYVPQVHVAR